MLYDFNVYHLVESESDWDCYLLSATAKRKVAGGNWAFPNIRISLTTFPGFKHNKATYTGGRSTFKKSCHTYPVNLGASYGPVSAGTTVTEIKSCNDNPKVTRSLGHKLNNGTYRTGLYTVYAASQLPRVGMQKWIRVPEGKTPPFYVLIKARKTKCVKRNAVGQCFDWKDYWGAGKKQSLSYDDSTPR